ncbi:MAG: hypothetical protein [Wendovervirus sonii]|uniref:Uncharacterized protein n=1 Tax=phage Lak_Megaphage_Sonny TaxID=3109229 RepID=A0ABZ0Z484_9CAUD|nr:MAG: hypothetical protein [phage Lak_Megaphage_Sonny]
MKQLYKKIYEAINTGIQNALILDDEDNISMNYQHKKIINNSNIISYYVEELLNDIDIKYNYEQIIKYYEESGYKYKVKNFDELRNIFNKLLNLSLNASFEWISNMKDYISIVLADNTEINFYEETDKEPLFLRLANDDILGTENEILIYLHEDHYISKKTYIWQTTEKQIQDDNHIICTIDKKIAEKDYSGYETCLRIHDIVSKDPDTYGNVPAIDQCLKLNINGYQGYLPSIGQLKIMANNINVINYVFFKYLKLNKIYLNEYKWWSSTEYWKLTSWVLRYGSSISTYKTTQSYRVFPLFAHIKN